MINFIGYYHNQKELRNYRCNNYNLRRVSEDRHCRNHISGIKIESVITETLKELFLSPDFLFERALDEMLPGNIDPEATRDRYHELYGLLMEIDDKQKRNEELYIEGSIAKERFLEHKTTLETKKEEYSKGMSKEWELIRSSVNKETAEKSWKEVMEEIREETESFFEKADYLQMKELVNLTIDRVIIPVDRKNPVRIIVKIPMPVDVELRYMKDEYMEFEDDYGKTHEIGRTGELVPRIIPLDSTKKPFTCRTVEFIGDGEGG